MAKSDKAADDKEAPSRPGRASNTSKPTETDPDLLNHDSRLQPDQTQDSETTRLPAGTTETDLSKMAEPSPLTETGNPKDAIEPFDWEQLEERYLMKMSECEQAEQAIYQEFNHWIKVFETWASTTSVHENERSHKRLKTRISYVQGAEHRLEEKRQHYVNVVKAFESALALLGPMS